MSLRDAVRFVFEARSRAALRQVYRRLQQQEGWRRDGWDRGRILKEVDPDFVHHAEHMERLLNGGAYDGGQRYPGGGGLRWGGLIVQEGEAVLRVMGSHEWRRGREQEVYQQTVRFANFARVAEAGNITWPEKAQVLLTMDGLRVHCDCEAYRFFHQRAATVKGFALVPEERAAPSNNPNDRSGACKHLNVVLRWLGAQQQRMASELKQYHEGKAR